MTPLGVVEAKKYGSDISGDILQSERYSQSYEIKGDEKLAHPGGHTGHFPGWPISADAKGPPRYYRVPFAYSTNGRPYLRQIETKSGIWFRDLRLPSNHARALNGWHSPDHLIRLLESDAGSAEAKLRDEPFGYLDLRDYQVRAVQAVEAGIAQGGRHCLVAMATGTGKTRTVIGLIYRLLKAKRFNRVLFLV